MHPLVRWQYRGGVPEEDRKAFLFTDITDSKGRKFDIPVLVCGLAGNRAIYFTGMGCKTVEEMSDEDYADACAMLKAWKPKAKA